MAIRVYIKTYNYHELNTNYHKLILFRYLQNKIYVPPSPALPVPQLHSLRIQALTSPL